MERLNRMPDLRLVSLLDDLRSAYELAKHAGEAELQQRLMGARRLWLVLLQENLTLRQQINELQSLLAAREAQARRRRVEAEEALFSTRRDSPPSRKPS
jgi:hypothetical protein